MKTTLLWFVLWCKRIFRRPLLLLTIFLMPCAVLFLQQCHTGKDAVLRVALCTDGTSPHSSTDKLMKRMLALSDSTIYFYQCDRETLEKDVKDRTANCGYLLPENLDEKLIDYVQKKKPFITAVRAENEVTTKIVDEIILSKTYQAFSYYMLKDFLMKKHHTIADEAQLKKDFQSYCSNELLFQFEYLGGEKNSFLNSNRSNVLMLPARGILSVLLLLTCLAGCLICYEDQATGLVYRMNVMQKRLAAAYSLLIPGLLALVMALISLKIAGVFQNPLKETASILCYLFACLGLVTLLRKLLPRKELLLASMPVMALISLLLPPVFLDFKSILPSVGQINRLLPTTWYLQSIHSPKNMGALLLYGGICFLLSALLRRKTDFN